MKDKEKIVGTLGQMMEQAARASITRGALYDPGEIISNDARGAWTGIAQVIVNLVEHGKLEEDKGKEVQRGEG